MIHRYGQVAGCIVGTAIGDAAGLRREGLSARRAASMYGREVSPNLLCGRGFCSDDTEHTVMLARALLSSHGDVDQFQRALGKDLRWWLLMCPAGVGLGTLRAIVKLWMGFRPPRSGVPSAGNGPAMRAALLGLYATSDQQLRDLVGASTQLTHSDPRAEQGAIAIAMAARFAATNSRGSKQAFVQELSAEVHGDPLRERLQTAADGLASGLTVEQYAQQIGVHGYVSGYVNDTVPIAIYCWAASDTFRETVASAVGLGGDTDSVAAIAGALAGTQHGLDGIPSEWINQLTEWPRDVDWMKSLARAWVAQSQGEPAPIPSMRWKRTTVRNALFTVVILAMGFRRLLPPY